MKARIFVSIDLEDAIELQTHLENDEPIDAWHRISEDLSIEIADAQQELGDE